MVELALTVVAAILTVIGYSLNDTIIIFDRVRENLKKQRKETLREVRRCTRDRIVINTFMLERGPYLTEFVNQMTRINKGRAFFVSPERLGEYILVDYVSGKQRRQRSRAS